MVCAKQYHGGTQRRAYVGGAAWGGGLFSLCYYFLLVIRLSINPIKIHYLFIIFQFFFIVFVVVVLLFLLCCSLRR